MSKQLDLYAESRRDLGIERASGKAERVNSGWNEDASVLLREWLALIKGNTFLTEQFVHWAHDQISAPPDPRAWGAPIRRAALAGKIIRCGYAPANTSNRSPKCLWKAR